MSFCASFAFALAMFGALDAHAEGERAVVVLEPSELGAEEWPEGTRTVIAELNANNFTVIEQHSSAATSGGLLSEVAHTARPERVLGVVAVLREGDSGAAYVWTAHGERVLRDDTFAGQSPVTRGVVAEGAVALRVVELFRAEALQFPPQPPRAAPPTKSQAKAETVVTEPESKFAFAWLGLASAIYSNVRELPLSLNLGVDLRVLPPVSVDVSGEFTLLPGTFQTAAGSLSIRAQQLGAHVLFDPFRAHSVAIAVGVGASALWLKEKATGVADFQGVNDSTSSVLVNVRARLVVRHGSFLGLLIVDPGLTVPAVSVRAGDSEVAELGRPWIGATLGAGWAF